MSDNSKELRLTMLGAGQEVGRSCCVLRHQGYTVVCDAGINPALSGLSSLPFIDDVDWSKVDAVLITHFHLDHAAAVPYITEKTNFRDGKGKVYMTHATKALHKLMMQDIVSTRSFNGLYTKQDLANSENLIASVSTLQTIHVCPGITFTAYPAGHVLGACMFFVDFLGSQKVLYTGDYSCSEDRYLVPAQPPPIVPDVLVVESTFGTHSLEPRADIENRLTSMVHGIVRRGGHVLLPAFAVGQAQDLLLILDEYWENMGLHDVPIYFVSKLAEKAMMVYRRHARDMNERIHARLDKGDNPFAFRHVSNISGTKGREERIAYGPPCVLLASPGSLQYGVSRRILELWAPDARNGVVISGYAIQGTLARDIISEPNEIISQSGKVLPRRLSVHSVTMSAHVDFTQNSQFIEQVSAKNVVLVHGEKFMMSQLNAALEKKFTERDMAVDMYMPQNLETLNFRYHGEHLVKVYGSLAQNLVEDPSVSVSGYLVKTGDSFQMISADSENDTLREYTGLNKSTMVQKLRMRLACCWPVIRWHLEQLFGSFEGTSALPMNKATFQVLDIVDVNFHEPNLLVLEWTSSLFNDMVTGAVVALVLIADQKAGSPDFDTALTTLQQDELGYEERLKQSLTWLLSAHFGDVVVKDLGPQQISIKAEGCLFSADLDTLDVQPSHLYNELSGGVGERLKEILRIASMTVNSLDGIIRQ